MYLLCYLSPGTHHIVLLRTCLLKKGLPRTGPLAGTRCVLKVCLTTLPNTRPTDHQTDHPTDRPTDPTDHPIDCPMDRPNQLTTQSIRRKKKLGGIRFFLASGTYHISQNSKTGLESSFCSSIF